jgi:hypothetical protein
MATTDISRSLVRLRLPGSFFGGIFLLGSDLGGLQGQARWTKKVFHAGI